MSAFKRIRRTRIRSCALCGSHLQPTTRDKYDPFWIVLLIFGGSVFAFYLLGIVVMVVGLLLLRAREAFWACPKCAPEYPV